MLINLASSVPDVRVRSQDRRTWSRSQISPDRRGGRPPVPQDCGYRYSGYPFRQRC